MIFASLALALAVITIITFVRNTSSSFDENFYTALPSNFYVIKNVPAQKTGYETAPGKASPAYDDTIRSGWYIKEINGREINSGAELFNTLNNYPKDKKIEFLVSHASIWRSQGERYSVYRRDLPDSFYTIVPSGALVIDVIKDGASARAGMKVGDLIIKVNGKTFRDANQADSLMRSLQSGNTIAYTLKRDNIDFDINVRLSSFGITFSYLAVLISGLSMFVLGFYVAFRRPQITAARLLGFALLSIGFVLMNLIDERVVTADSVMRVLAFIVNVFVFIGIPVLIHSTWYFPKERTDLLKRKWIIWAPYLLSGLLAAVFIAGFFRSVNLSLPFPFFYLFFLFVLYKAAIDIIYRKNNSPEQKQLRKALRLTSITLMVAYPLREIAIGKFGLTFANDIFNIILLVIPVAYLYTIGRFHLLDLDIKIRRNILYIFSSVLWNIAAFCILLVLLLGLSTLTFKLPNIHLTGASIEVLDKPLEPYLRVFYDKFIIAFVSVIAVILFWKVKKRVQTRLDRKFYRISFDYKRATTDFSDILASNLTISDLAAGIVRELGELVQLKRVGVIVFRNEEKVSEQNYFGFNSDSLREFCYATGAKLIEAIKQFHGEFRIDYLPEPIKGVFKKCDFRYIIPIRSKGRIVAALIIGEKRSEASFHRDDLVFLSSIAGQCSVALENAMLYEGLAIQERIKHELDIARRIQLASLPQDIPDIAGLDISGISLPALEVGGDFYDFLNGNANELTVVIGDVSGKGTSAALYMSKVQGILRTLHEFDLSPRKLFIRTNELLYKYLEKSSFISAIGGRLNTMQKRIHLSRAGHLPLLFYRASTGQIEKVIPKGLVLGLSKDSLFERNLEEVEISFERGDVFLFVTDGIIEARNSSHQEYGEERLIQTFNRNINSSAEEIRNSIISSVQVYAGEMQQFDDMTVVVIKICC